MFQITNQSINFYPSEKYESVSWDDDIPDIWKNKTHVPNHQPVHDCQASGQHVANPCKCCKYFIPSPLD